MMPDIFLRAVPADPNAADMRLYDPTIPDAPIIVPGGVRRYYRTRPHHQTAVRISRGMYYVDE